MAYSTLRYATAMRQAAAQKSQPRGLARSKNSADDREANCLDRIFEPVVVDVGV
jgi:hypothetical protein